MSDKKGLLPIVNEDIGKALSAELLQEPGDNYINGIIKRLNEDNPCVLSLIHNFAKKSIDQKSILYMGILVYRLLESQAEADKMNREL